MDFFTISDIENLTQIKAHTLRTWEHRYGLSLSKRKNSKHRYYDGEDLKHILRIAALYNNGLKISHIACLSVEEIKIKALGIPGPDSGSDIYLTRLIESSIDMDTDAFEKNLKEAVSIFGLEKTMIEICFPFLSKLGMFWLSGHIIPAQEHFASAIITKEICLAIDQLPATTSTSNSRRVLLFTPPGENHEISLLFMEYLLKKNGVKLTYMGISVKNETLIEYVAMHHVTELYFHLITNLIHSNINNYVQQLSILFPDKKICCSGISCIGLSNVSENVQVLESKEDLMAFASY